MHHSEAQDMPCNRDLGHNSLLLLVITYTICSSDSSLINMQQSLINMFVFNNTDSFSLHSVCNA